MSSFVFSAFSAQLSFSGSLRAQISSLQSSAHEWLTALGCNGNNPITQIAIKILMVKEHRMLLPNGRQSDLFFRQESVFQYRIGPVVNCLSVHDYPFEGEGEAMLEFARDGGETVGILFRMEPTTAAEIGISRIFEYRVRKFPIGASPSGIDGALGEIDQRM